MNNNETGSHNTFCRYPFISLSFSGPANQLFSPANDWNMSAESSDEGGGIWTVLRATMPCASPRNQAFSIRIWPEIAKANAALVLRKVLGRRQPEGFLEHGDKAACAFIAKIEGH